MKVAIIGSGPSGLALAKQLQDLSIKFVVFERDADIGGVWNIKNKHSVMYDSAHTISSKKMTEFSEFPMPADYAEYISHHKMLEYLRLYADNFNLRQHIRFSSSVNRVEKTNSGKYVLSTDKGVIEFDHVAVATGHENKENIPDLNVSDFCGQILHTRDYKEASIFKNKNVLIIGAGNSGCDIACEAVSSAARVMLSIRRGYYFVPKFILGSPADIFAETSVKLRIPMFLRQWINQGILRFFQGNIQKLGFQKPDHRLFESHPIVNELLIYYVRHDDIGICKDVDWLLPNGVKFVDGSEIDVDIIVFATGYVPDFSFLEKNLQPKVEELHLNLFSKKHYGLSFLGLLAPNGGVLGILESQARAVAIAIKLNCREAEFQRLIQKNVILNGGIRYISSARHQIEVDQATYRREIKRQIDAFQKMVTAQ